MVQELSFQLDPTLGQYVAEVTVSGDCNLHLKFPEAAVVALHKRTSGEDFALHRKYSICMLPYSFDEDLRFAVYPKDLRLVTAVQPTLAVCSINASESEQQEAIEDLQRRMAEQENVNDSQQQEIDRNTRINNEQQQLSVDEENETLHISQAQ